MFLRSSVLVLLFIALTAPVLMRKSRTVNVLFCIDRSESIAPQIQQQIVDRLKNVHQSMNPKDKAGVVVFATEPVLEKSLQEELQCDAIHAAVDPYSTNIAAAMRFSFSLFPEKGTNKLVLFTDGKETADSAASLAYHAAARGITVLPVVVQSPQENSDIYIKELLVPENANQRTPFAIHISVVSPQQTTGQLVVTRNNTIISSQSVGLEKGTSVFQYKDKLAASGLYKYSAQIITPQDTLYHNNLAGAFVRVEGKPQVLYIQGNSERSDIVEKTLAVQGIELTVKKPRDLTGLVNELEEYDACVLDNVSAAQLTYAAMSAMVRYVRDIGGGLVVIGGDKSFGPGAYKDTPIQTVLPVYVDIPTDMNISQLCLVFVIDRSSSMGTGIPGKTKLDMAKSAAYASIELLNPHDHVGILIFNIAEQWLVPVTSARNRQFIADNLATIAADGGTDLFTALRTAYIELMQISAEAKHIIVLTDGQTDEGDFHFLVRRMLMENITISTVAVGKDADRTLLEQIARWGEGRSYYTDDPESIPRIFTGETKLVKRKLITEKTVQPSVVQTHEIIAGIDMAAMPPIHGWVATYPKPNAAVILNAQQNPLLAAYHSGLGKTVAYTSDLKAQWGASLVNWKGYNQLAAQMVKWAQRKLRNTDLSMRITRTAAACICTVDAVDSKNNFINNLDLVLRVSMPLGTDTSITLVQKAPGLYTAAFAAIQDGDYYLALYDAHKPENGPQVYAVAVPYTHEFSPVPHAYENMQQLAVKTNGTILPLEFDMKTVFSPDNSSAKDSVSELWHYCVLAALLLFCVELVLRNIPQVR